MSSAVHCSVALSDGWYTWRHNLIGCGGTSQVSEGVQPLNWAQSLQTSLDRELAIYSTIMYTSSFILSILVHFAFKVGIMDIRTYYVCIQH